MSRRFPKRHSGKIAPKSSAYSSRVTTTHEEDMKNKTQQDDESELPFIDATAYYDTRGAAAVLGQTEGLLRQWRLRNIGPKYQQSVEGGRCQYLGAWLIQFRRSIIVEPSAQGAEQ